VRKSFLGMASRRLVGLHYGDSQVAAGGLDIMRAKCLFALGLLLVGTNVFTYAYTRYRTTARVASKSVSAAKRFLEDQAFLVSDRNAPEATPEKHRAANDLISRISLSGGMYYWNNDALPYYGASILLVSTGLMLPWVRARKENRELADSDQVTS
jgi:hypothetical protein